MKKLLVICMVLVMCLCLCACGEEGPQETVSHTETAAESTEVTTASSTETENTEATEPTKITEAPTIMPPESPTTEPTEAPATKPTAKPTTKPTGHTHEYTEKVTKAATCTVSGTKTFTCKDCGNSYTEVIKAMGHNWKNATCTAPKQCQGCGQTDGAALGHSIQNGTCVRCGLKDDTEEKAAIVAENERHNTEIAEIEGRYDASISVNEETIDSLKAQYGISYVSSKSYYQNRESSVRTEITNLSYKLAYSSSAAEQARLKKEINSLKEELTEINICLRIIDLQDENDYLETQRDAAIAQENRIHKQNLADIEAKYS